MKILGGNETVYEAKIIAIVIGIESLGWEVCCKNRYGENKTFDDNRSHKNLEERNAQRLRIS